MGNDRKKSKLSKQEKQDLDSFKTWLNHLPRDQLLKYVLSQIRPGFDINSKEVKKLARDIIEKDDPAKLRRLYMEKPMPMPMPVPMPVYYDSKSKVPTTESSSSDNNASGNPKNETKDDNVDNDENEN